MNSPAPIPIPDSVKRASQWAVNRMNSGAGKTGDVNFIVHQVEQVVGLEVRRVLLEKLTEIKTDVIARTHICNRCRKVFISRRKGDDIRWCDDCRK